MASAKPTLSSVSSLTLAPSTLTLTNQFETSQLISLLKDANGQFLDPSAYALTWTVDKPDLFAIDSTGVVKALQSSGFANVTVKEALSGLSATMVVTMGRGGGGGGNGSSTQEALTGTVKFQF